MTRTKLAEVVLKIEKNLPHAQMSTGLPYASFLSTSGDK